MRTKARSILAGTTALAVLMLLAPAPAGAGAGARLEGMLVDVDGRPASGYRIHLIGADGADLARSATTDEGLYDFRGLASGAYSLGIESPEGRMAPVAAPPVRLGRDELARRDIKLLEADPASRQAAAGGNYSVGLWWAGLSSAAKVWTIVGVVVVVGATAAALDTGDNEPASPD